MSDVIADLLAKHRVTVHPVDAQRGPTTTLHTYRLGDGVKVSAFTGLQTDMAVAVGQEAIRIHAPVKGTNLVGVEIPNAVRTFPTFAFDRLDDMPLLDLMPLSFPVGVDQNNRPVISSLTKMPHLLIAGQTGGGKSVALTTLITALIAQHSPTELNLHLVDPKRVELGMFEDAPQVKQVVTDIDDVADMLDEVVYEMDQRYSLFEEAEVRSLVEYNRGPAATRAEPELPYIVVVIDELADLMIQRKKDVEPLLVRIAQLGRAAGIHLVLATQRPTRDVITGLIKANVPSRWAFTVASTSDSMVVLDQPGANALIGKGDSLWHPAGQPAPERVQSYLTDDRVLADVVAWAQDEWAPTVPSMIPGPDGELILNPDAWKDVGYIDGTAGIEAYDQPGDTEEYVSAEDYAEEYARWQREVVKVVFSDPAVPTAALVEQARQAVGALTHHDRTRVDEWDTLTTKPHGFHRKADVDTVADAGFRLGERLAIPLAAGAAFAVVLYALMNYFG